MSKKEQKTKTIRDSVTVEWLTNIIGYIHTSKHNGFPVEFEEIRDDMKHKLTQWTALQLADIPIIDLCRKLNIASENGKEYVEITWTAFGIMHFSIPSMTFGKNWVSSIEIQGPSFNYEKEAPKDINERINDIVTTDFATKLQKLIFTICSGLNGIADQLNRKSLCFTDIYNKGVTSVQLEYIRQKLTGSTPAKFNKLLTVEKKLTKLKEKLLTTEDHFARLDQLKQTLFDTLYNPAEMKAYVKHCIDETAYTLEQMTAFMDEWKMIQETDRSTTNWQTNVYMRKMDTTNIHSIHDLITKDYATFDDMVILPHKDMTDYNYITTGEGFSKYVAEHFCKNVTCEKIPYMFSQDTITGIIGMYPEIFHTKRTLNTNASYYRNSAKWDVDITQPIEECFNEYDTIAKSYTKAISQFITATPDTDSRIRYPQNQEEMSRQTITTGSVNVILPTNDLIDAIYRICADEHATSDNNTPVDIIYYSMMNDSEQAYHTLPSATTIDTIDIDIRLNNDLKKIENCAQQTYFLFNDYKITCFVSKMLYKYGKAYTLTGKFDADEYKNDIIEFIDNLTSDDSACLIAHGTEKYNTAITGLLENTNKAIKTINAIQTALLSSDMPDFIEYCADKGFVDKKVAKTKIKALEKESK